jgi:hypothetical protein
MKLAKKRGPTVNEQRDAIKEMGKVLEDLRKGGAHSQVLLDKLDELKGVWEDELYEKWFNSK